MRSAQLWKVEVLRKAWTRPNVRLFLSYNAARKHIERLKEGRADLSPLVYVRLDVADLSRWREAWRWYA